jgi:tRNA (guanine37-N1)-methyltransferase
VFEQAMAQRLAKKKHLILLCGHYEGVDERVMKWVDQQVSIGDYVLTGGEIPALVVADAVARLVPGVVGDPASVEEESFSDGLLEYPHFTRPRVWRGRKVPDILLSGDHRRIAQWRREQSVERTRLQRPLLLKKKKA